MTIYLTYFNALRTKSSRWVPDQTPEVGPFFVAFRTRVSVLRGRFPDL